MRSARLNERATIDRTLEAGGYFRPVYRDRQVPPAYLFLIDRRHAEDHVAEMAAELGAALRREQISYTAFDYHGDPRYCRPVGEIAAERSPAALAGVYGDRTLFLVGDGDALFDPDTGRPHGWMQEFAAFEQKYMLTTDPVWWQSHRVDDWAQAGFQVLPLTTAGLGQLRTTRAPIGYDDPRDLPLPRRFALSPGHWLEERRLKQPVLRTIVRELKEYLGGEGFLLLCATAAYPGIYWRLTRAMDAQLGLTGSDRAVRLRKLGRLPWYRYGRMPDMLRVALLRSLDRSRRRRITDAYHALIEHRAEDPLRLPVAVPDWKSARAEVREMVQASARHEPFGDRVFADVVRGRKPRLLEFGLPSWGAPTLKRQQWRGLVGPILSGLVLIPAAIWLNVWARQAWLGPLAERQAMSTMQERHGKVRVQLSSPASLRPIAQALERSLVSWGFQVASSSRNDQVQRQNQLNAPARSVEQMSKSGGSTREPNRLMYRPGQQTSADLIAERVAFLYYGLKPELEQVDSQSLNDVDVLIELRGRPRGFRDELKTGPTVFRDPLRNGQDGPDMVLIPAGSFQMGDLQGKGMRDERPVHEVRIPRSFAMSRYETTFEEYDRFARETKRSLLADEGWGRGRRPVINVSWDDAKVYAEWLSQQTGKPYRLPTEAEWEYAARSGGKDEIWAGTSDAGRLSDFAVYAGNSRGRTAPVGGKMPNGLGLYDMSGNVWEWVEDCWHEVYKGAPSDGSAWLDTGGGRCSQRVIRGGVWDANPKYLRVSDRGWQGLNYGLNLIGFRLVQDLD
jgi:formylglycine-generating enzyme required for sulfatase activity